MWGNDFRLGLREEVMRHANRMECCAQFLKYWRRNSLELRRSIVYQERILPRHSARTEDPQDVSGPGARYSSSDCRQSPLQAAYSVVVDAVLPTALNVQYAPTIVWYFTSNLREYVGLRFGCCSSRGRRHTSHLTLPKHNCCCCCACSSTSACVLLSVPMFPYPWSLCASPSQLPWSLWLIRGGWRNRAGPVTQESDHSSLI